MKWKNILKMRRYSELKNQPYMSKEKQRIIDDYMVRMGKCPHCDGSAEKDKCICKEKCPKCGKMHKTDIESAHCG